MSQNKKSFEAYLKKVRKDWESQYNKASRPRDFKDCPFCGSVIGLNLLKESITHIVPPYLFEGIFWVYRCDNCSERFTTCESDTISISTIKLKVK
jgi:uncharacterized protein with PIN domain